MELTLIRHGESEANVRGRWQGQGDSPLSPKGRQQVARLGQRFANAKPDALYSSDLIRARETATALALPFETSKLWREIDVGAWEGLSRLEARLRFPDEIRRLDAGATDVPVGGGESWDAVQARAVAAAHALCAGHRAQRVIVVSHGGVIATLAATTLSLGIRPAKTLGRILNTSLTTVGWQEHAASLIRYNDVAHLDSAPPEPSGEMVVVGVVAASAGAGHTDLHRFRGAPWLGPMPVDVVPGTPTVRAAATALHDTMSRDRPPQPALQEHEAAPIRAADVQARAVQGRSLLVVLDADRFRTLVAEVLTVSRERIAEPTAGTFAALGFAEDARRLLSLTLPDEP